MTRCRGRSHSCQVPKGRGGSAGPPCRRTVPVHRRDGVAHTRAGLARFTEEQVAVAPPWYLHAVGLVRAVEARDVAIEGGDAAAWNFAQDVRTIIGLAIDRGASLTELAAEYPGGADFIDGPHIDAAISELAFRERPLGEESATLASLGDDPELRSFVGRDGAVWTQREPSGRYEKDTSPQALAYAERVAPDRAASSADLMVTAASLAVAARDAAVEQGDQTAAVVFAADARRAIGAAVEAGITLDELAWEIDYPGGAAAMDGPQVDQEIAEMQDRGPAFAPDPLADARDAGPHWLEVREVQMPDGSAVETLHGTPEMVAAWAYPPVSDPVATEEGLSDDRLAAEVASLRSGSPRRAMTR